MRLRQLGPDGHFGVCTLAQQVAYFLQKSFWISGGRELGIDALSRKRRGGLQAVGSEEHWRSQWHPMRDGGSRGARPTLR
jgi:hypothetical protein